MDQPWALSKTQEKTANSIQLPKTLNTEHADDQREEKRKQQKIGKGGGFVRDGFGWHGLQTFAS